MPLAKALAGFSHRKRRKNTRLRGKSSIPEGQMHDSARRRLYERLSSFSPALLGQSYLSRSLRRGPTV